MSIFTLIRRSTFGAVATVSLVLAGCGGGGGPSYPTPTLPAGAVVIDATNGEVIALTAVDSLSSLGSTVVFKGEALPSLQEVLEFSTSIVRDLDLSQPQIASAATEVVNCSFDPNDASFGTMTITSTGNAASYSGSVTFNNCNMGGSGVVMRGGFQFSSSTNSTTFATSITMKGNLTITAAGESLTMLMRVNAIEYADFTASVNYLYSVSGSGIGFLVSTPVNLFFDDMGDIVSGQLLIQGGNNTKIIITFLGSGSAKFDVYNSSETVILSGNIPL